jgi:hypothetical protein
MEGEKVLAADGRGGSLVVVEVEGMDGVARRIQLWDDCEPDWRALVCDKAGVPAQTPAGAESPSVVGCRSCDSIGGVRASLFDTVLGGDLADSILMRLGPAALALLSAASRLMRARCRCDALWIRHWRVAWIRTQIAAAAAAKPAASASASARPGETQGIKPAEMSAIIKAAVGGGGGGSREDTEDADGFDGYLESIVAGARASGQLMSVRQMCWPRHMGQWKVGELQVVYGYRMAARRQVRTAWELGAQFFSAASLGPGLTDPQLWDLERCGSAASLIHSAWPSVRVRRLIIDARCVS